MEPNFADSTIWTGDNLNILRGMNSGCVDLIYLDPPFNSKANYAAPTGSKAAGAEFKDTWGLSDVNLAWHGEIKHEYPGLYDLLNATRKIHGDSMMSYLIYMAIRVMEMRRVLKDTGSLYLHCDHYAGAYLKLMLDSVFGRRNFRNEIVWCYSQGSKSKKHFGRKHDTVFFYVKSDRAAFNWQNVRLPLTAHKQSKSGTNYGGRMGVDEDGREYVEKWGTGKKKLYRYYLDEGKIPEDYWTDINSIQSGAKERTGYPTQKPLALLKRIICASSNDGDMVLDPFCGCATACIAAQDEGRQWAGIDISAKAADLVKDRLKNELGFFGGVLHRTDTPKRTDLGKIKRYNHPENTKYLYGEQGGFCNGCGEHFQARLLEVDHLIPQVNSGTDHISNLQLLCSNCNRIKGARSQEYLMARLLDKGFIRRQKPL